MRSKFEKKAQKELEADGWLVDWKVSSGGFTQNRNTPTDYFHLFDLLAYKPGIIRMIAIKGQGGVPRKLRDDITAFRPPKGMLKEIWRYSQPTTKGKRIKNTPYRIRREIIV